MGILKLISVPVSLGAWSAVQAEPIGHLGHRLRPPVVRGPPNSNNILYNIAFSSKKKKNTDVIWRLIPSPNLLAYRRKDYKKQKEEINKKM